MGALKSFQLESLIRGLAWRSVDQLKTIGDQLGVLDALLILPADLPDVIDALYPTQPGLIGDVARRAAHREIERTLSIAIPTLQP